MSAGTTFRWFVVATHAKFVHGKDGHERMPASLVHAKEMGSTETACGLRADTWPKWWHLRFPMRGVAMCDECVWVTGTGGRR